MNYNFSDQTFEIAGKREDERKKFINTLKPNKVIKYKNASYTIVEISPKLSDDENEVPQYEYKVRPVGTDKEPVVADINDIFPI